MSGSSWGRSAEKTGWDEYWEARRSLDLVVRRQPQHVRALVARAWIDYIVRHQDAVGHAVGARRGHQEASARDRAGSREPPVRFLHARRGEVRAVGHASAGTQPEAVAEAGRELADDFPDNREVAAFLETREARGRRWGSYPPRVRYDFSVRRTELALSVSGIGGGAQLLSIALYPMAAEHPLLPMAYRIGLTPPRLPVSHRIKRINSTSPSNPPP
jgi:hypothetical protein